MANTYGDEIGSVRWCDQQKGYGFIRVVTPSSTFYNKDIFVHFSSINCDNSFKKIFPGEYVSLSVEEKEENGKLVCNNVTGVYGGQLLIDNSDHVIKVFNKRNRNNDELDSEVDAEVDAVVDA